MKPVGIRVEKSFALPLVAVINPEGVVVDQWQRLQNISLVETALESMGME
ncbi:MAG: hypothetical protein ACOZF0_08520 [Thermodesulfobacteriota bacterium]